MKRGMGLFLSISIFALLTAVPEPVEPFYEGKILRILVPSAPGSLTDVEARVVARHLGRHVPGNPGVIVQSITGGGGINLANTLYNRVKPDGLAIAVNGSLVALHKILGTRGVKYDVGRFNWLGTFADPTWVIIIHRDAPYKSVASMASAAEAPKMGAPSARHAIFLMARIYEEALGLKFRHVFGYSPPEIELAIDRREVDGQAKVMSSIAANRREWLEQGFPIFAPTSRERLNRFPDTPTLWELIKDEPTRKFVEVAVVPFDAPRPWNAPPGIPNERLQVLRQAFLKTLKDAQFLKDAKRTGLTVVPKRGEEVEQVIRRLTQAPPEILGRIPKLLSR